MTLSLLHRAGGLATTGAIVGLIVAAQFWAFMPPTAALATTATPSWTGTPTLTLTPTPTRTPIIPCGCVGDVNDDGRVDSVDAQLILEFDARLLVSLRCGPCADVNSDEHLDALDALLILQFKAGFHIPPWFP